MVQYRDLNAPPSRMLADVVADMKAQGRQSKTGDAGVKDLGESGDVVWPRPDGSSTSVRELDEGLEAARDRIDEASADLIVTQERLEAAETAVQEADERLGTMETVTLPGAVQALEEADRQASQALTELDARLTGVDGPKGDLSAIRESLAEAVSAVESAVDVARTANEAANAASQAALEAAGIAASKGRVIIQETEPTGEDRKASNIWIKPIPDDPKTGVVEKSVTYVYMEATGTWEPTTSSELAQAAQNALDAREAAQQAAQRAETAISNAATAQTAAEAAQRTANQATTDARTAHNEAVAAQGDATEALEKYGPLDQRTIDAQAAADAARARAEEAYAEAESKATPQQVAAAQKAATDAAAADAKAKADAAQAEATRIAAADAKAKADAAQAEATRIANTKATPAEVKAAKEAAEKAAKEAAALDATAKADAAKAAAAADAKAKADAALAAARADLATARGQITDEIKASANGKNAITISTNAPTTSTPGVVAGDTWWRVDGSSNIYGQWRWTGSSWSPVTIRSEVIANLDAAKIGTGYLSADRIESHSLTADKVLIGIGTDLVADGGFNSPLGEGWKVWGGTSSVWRIEEVANGTNYLVCTQGGSGWKEVYSNPPVRVTPGQQYLVAADFRKPEVWSAAYPRIAVFTFDGSGARIASWAIVGHQGNTTDWVQLHGDFTVPEGTASIAFVMSVPSNAANGSQVHFRNPTFRLKSGATLIENGAVTTDKLLAGAVTAEKITVTEALSANIVNAMSVNTKKVVVTKEAILNHATLIGQTVVDDINVQGKLIGKDGVFTGTVDFENINVTDQVLAFRISGEHIYGTVIEGGEIRTTDGLPGQVILSDEGFVDPGSQAKYPGIRIIPPDTSELVSPPGMGPNNNGFIITGGRNTTGGRGFSIYAPTQAAMVFQRGDARSNVVAADGYAWATAHDGNGNRGEILARSTYSQVRATAADGTAGLIQATPSSAVVATKDPGGNVMSRIMSNGREAYLWSTGSDGLGRVLSVDSDGVWVKAQRGDGSGYWDHVSLVPQVRPFQYSAQWNMDLSPSPIMVQHLPGGKLCQAQARIQNLTGSSFSLPYNTWVTLNLNPIPADLRGGYTDYIDIRLPEADGRGVLEMNYSTGSIRIRNLHRNDQGGINLAWHNNNSIWFSMRWFAPN